MLKPFYCLLFVTFTFTISYAERPNFVWIIADDMSPDTGTYGLDQISTPNLDRMSQEGCRYSRAYATAPVCSSSRSAFILGCYQTTTGLHPHDVENPQPLPKRYVPLPTILKNNGWYVTNAAAAGAVRNGKTISKGKTHYNFKHDPKEMYDGDDWRNRKPGQPFFAQFQITEPHRPFPIPKDFDEPRLSNFPLPENYPDDPLMRRDWYAYHRSVEVVDQRVGTILDQLRDEGVLDNTIVMFFADHGRPMPWGKQWLSVEGLQVPLIIRGNGFNSKSVESRITSLIDLAPTMLDLANVPIPTWMEGMSFFRDDYAKRVCLFAARDRCGDAMDRVRAVITPERWFVQNFNPGLSRFNWSGYKEASYPGMPLLRELHRQNKLSKLQTDWIGERRSEYELYDLTADSKGIRSVVDESSYQNDVIRLKQTLNDWIKASHDQGMTGDPATEPSMDEIAKAKRDDYRKTWSKRLGESEPTDSQRLDWWRKSYGLQ